MKPPSPIFVLVLKPKKKKREKKNSYILLPLLHQTLELEPLAALDHARTDRTHPRARAALPFACASQSHSCVSVPPSSLAAPPFVVFSRTNPQRRVLRQQSLQSAPSLRGSAVVVCSAHRGWSFSSCGVVWFKFEARVVDSTWLDFARRWTVVSLLDFG